MIRLAAVLTMVLALAACNGQDPFEIPTNPTPPDPTTVTFQGTVTRNGAQTHTFNTTASGTVTVTLAALGPDETLIIGLSLGTWNGNACQVVLAKDNATQGSIITGGVSSLGSLCVRIYDVGNIAATTPVTYSIQVIHP